MAIYLGVSWTDLCFLDIQKLAQILEKTPGIVPPLVRVQIQGASISTHKLPAVVAAVWSGIAYVSVHFKNESVTTRMYWFPELVTGSGPNMYVHMRSKGTPTSVLPRGTIGVFVGLWFAAQVSHFCS